MKHALLGWWFDLMVTYHMWNWYRLQRRANELQLRAKVHREMSRYCNTRSLEHEEASNA